MDKSVFFWSDMKINIQYSISSNPNPPCDSLGTLLVPSFPQIKFSKLFTLPRRECINNHFSKSYSGLVSVSSSN